MHLVEALPLVEVLAREGAEGGPAEDGVDEEPRVITPGQPGGPKVGNFH